MSDTLRGLRDALDSYAPGDPMRAAIQRGIDHLTGEPEILPTDTRPRNSLYNTVVAPTPKVTSNQAGMYGHDNNQGRVYHPETPTRREQTNG